MKFFSGDILNSGATIICHQVNCMGVMGSGLALQIKNKFPEVFGDYWNAVNLLNNECFGGCLVSKRNDGQGYIANLFSQYFYKGIYKTTDEYVNSGVDPFKLPEINTDYTVDTRFTNYEALYRSLKNLRDKKIKYLLDEGKINESDRIAFPYQMGSNRGGGDWNIVKTMIDSIFSNTEFRIEIWQKI